MEHKRLTLNLLKAFMVHGGAEMDLTKNELGILRIPMLNKGNVIPRDSIIDKLWKREESVDESTLNVNIVRLRKKLISIGLLNYL